MFALLRLGVAGQVLFSLALSLWAALTLPERVPVHFGPDGSPDRWGGRVEVLVLGIVAVSTVALFAVLARGIGRHWSLDLVNLPGKSRWLPRHEAAPRERHSLDLLGLAQGVGLAVNGAFAGTVAAAGSTEGRLPGWSMALVHTGGVVLVGWTVAVATWRYRRPSEDGLAVAGDADAAEAPGEGRSSLP